MLISRENIRLGRLDATDSEIEVVAKMANAHSFIQNLADKYDTKVGERLVFDLSLIIEIFAYFNCDRAMSS